ncbi:nuclear transport factor 2 family protein [Occallatibacter riparius]|uniref:Nuclear transport factor 2 family protein n=1 Tax=Occallatibacter riparius TaxID=1002689 RepID=A0A9J7BTE9_9BACT|nr:nuclear transport factor 2 family protein [Occallatibacter riparius]UWZ86148.1 nuclear transport factor 2 family protein [Occallatibacter riparius]
MKVLREVCVLGSLLFVALSIATAQSAPATDQQSATQIRQLIDTYTQAVDAADPNLAAKVFLTTPDVSFINPVGHERGWNQIADECVCASWARPSRSAR